MKRLFIVLFLCVAGGAFSQSSVRADQGLPGKYGPWPVTTSGSSGSWSGNTTGAFIDVPWWTLPDTRLGQLVSAGVSVNEATTATPFAITASSCLMIQCDVASRIEVSALTGNTATTTSVKVQADERYYKCLRTTGTSIAQISTTGTSTCQVYRLTQS